MTTETQTTETEPMNAAQLVRWHDGERYVCALAIEGRKHMHAVHVDDTGVRVATAPKEEMRYATPLLRRGEPYPMERFLRNMRRVARERGITAGAQKILDEVQP